MPSKKTFKLLNPYIEGSISRTVRAKDSFSASKKIYNSLSKYFTNHLDEFYMTIQNTDDGTLSHMKINEKFTNQLGGVVQYKLKTIPNSFTVNQEKELINTIKQLEKQNGGRHRKKKYSDFSDSDSDFDSISDSDSDSEFFYNSTQPISKFIYYYLPYYQLNTAGLSSLDRARLFFPTFNLPINPTMEVRLNINI